MIKHIQFPKNFKFTPGSIAKRCQHLVKLLPQEKRQEALDLFRSGMSAGMVADKTEIEVELVAALIAMNLEFHGHHTLRKDSI